MFILFITTFANMTWFALVSPQLSTTQRESNLAKWFGASKHTHFFSDGEKII